MTQLPQEAIAGQTEKSTLLTKQCQMHENDNRVQSDSLLIMV